MIGEMKTLYKWRLAFLVLAVLSLASCNSDDNVERRLTAEQKETYGRSISGKYQGQYLIIYKNKDCKERTDENGRHVYEALEENIDGVQLEVSDYKMQHVFFQDFPVSLISKVVDADEELSNALAEASPQAITARYELSYDTDYEHIKWAFTPNVMSLNLSYGGAEHHIRIEFGNNSEYYLCTPDELKEPNSFLSFAKSGVAIQLKAIYDGSDLIQHIGSENGNFMHILFKVEK